MISPSTNLHTYTWLYRQRKYQEQIKQILRVSPLFFGSWFIMIPSHERRNSRSLKTHFYFILCVTIVDLRQPFILQSDPAATITSLSLDPSKPDNSDSILSSSSLRWHQSSSLHQSLMVSAPISVHRKPSLITATFFICHLPSITFNQIN